jgi:hypothetical protein
VPLGLTLIEAQKVARRAEQLAVLKTVAEEQLLRLPGRYVRAATSGWICSSSSASSALASSVSWAAWARSQ